MSRSLILVALFLAAASSHSWLACSDYGVESDTTWDWTKCRGYARNAYVQCQAYGTNDLSSFGKECNMASNGQSGCHVSRPNPIESGYSATYPMAKYSQGQRVCLAWPAKNHAAATCTNQYIPDNGITLAISQVNPTVDPSQSQFDANLIKPFGNGVHAPQTIDFKGFQNCSRFCENTGNAFCSGCFNLPSNIATGLYTFQWNWFFNTVTDSYRTCFEAEIVAGNGQSPSSYPAPIPPPAPGSGPCLSQYTQCTSGGSACCSPYVCNKINDYYSQCGNVQPTTPPSTPIPPPANNPPPPPNSCPAGSSGCPCPTGGICDNGLTCTNNVCTGSTPTTPTTPSTPPTTPTTPTSCNVGSSGCACTSGGVCDSGLVCNTNKICSAKVCSIGLEGCPCTSGGACDSGLTCNNQVCSKSGTANIGGSKSGAESNMAKCTFAFIASILFVVLLI